MDAQQRRTILDSIDHASNQLQAARNHLDRFQYPEAVQAAQQSIEISIKAVLSLLSIQYPLDHEWDRKTFPQIAQQIREKKLVERLQLYAIALPRLLLLVNLWAVVYLPAKYGFQAGSLASPRELFREGEAKLVVEHASECSLAAAVLSRLSDDQMAALTCL